MIVNDTLEEIRAADMVPEDHYKLRIASTATPKNGDNSWAKLFCSVVNVKDQQNSHMIGKELQFWVISNRDGRKGLGDFWQHKHLYDPEGGWASGIPEDTNGEKHLHNLVGVTFDAKVRSFQKKDGTWGSDVQPITQPDQPMLGVPDDTPPF